MNLYSMDEFRPKENLALLEAEARIKVRITEAIKRYIDSSRNQTKVIRQRPICSPSKPQGMTFVAAVPGACWKCHVPSV